MTETHPKPVPAPPGLPQFYSFRRCPYAMRARLALQASNTHVELREVLLRDKPVELVDISAKATVPVLQLVDGQVIDESRQIMGWALGEHDPQDWLLASQSVLRDQANQLIDRNDGEFKTLLDRYKYSVRFPEQPPEHYRDAAMQILIKLDQQLAEQGYLLDGRETIADVALYPFVRQFAFVDKPWFDQQPVPALQAWLDRFVASAEFARIMVKVAPWSAGQAGIVFPFEHGW